MGYYLVLNQRNILNKNINAKPSTMQGTKDMSNVVTPTLLRVSLLIPKPARNNITIKANDFKNGDKSHNNCGVYCFKKIEQIIPKTTIPNTFGSLILLKSLLNIHPPPRIIAKIILIDIFPPVLNLYSEKFKNLSD